MSNHPLETLPDPPETLSDAAKTYWRELVDEYAITDRPGLLLLESALMNWDTAQRADEALRRDGLTVEGREGGMRPHPCVAISRDAHGAFLRAVKALNFDLKPAKPGRPARG